MGGVLTFNLTNENVRVVKGVMITPVLISGQEIAPFPTLSPGDVWQRLEKVFLGIVSLLVASSE